MLNKEIEERPSYITIPQPDGSEEPILTHDVTEATQLLGQKIFPVGDSAFRVDERLGQGYE